ncbi:activator of Hsp90 ATPase [Cantharellus anzutake]|uniref:activator of Hsp90 ATPase n=1 Tax=Cantharellus anzutake TaxID=1750568 RepID=UPI001904176D|nr:activator of Hsp90 ATPase [Cantharellus anzutake]KAF8337886.1 activator of Hsp90 ATPase [Cantharellus anzutake]
MSMSATTANWHWKSKAVTPWARNWFETELPTVIFTTSDGAVTAGISSVKDVEGDAELGMRKSKLITIFDVRLELAWTATHTDGSKISGSLTVPEVSHEVIIDGLTDYTYDWSLDKSEEASGNTPDEKLLSIVKTQLPPLLSRKFEEFPKALVDTHGKDILFSSSTHPKATKVLNSSTVRVEAQYMVSGQDLFSFLTDESRIPQWSRSPAISKAKEGTEYSLFGGGVVGKYLKVDSPRSFTQSWRLRAPSWPEDHEGTLKVTLDQQSDSTKLVMELSGVPKGQEDEIERNLLGY